MVHVVVETLYYDCETKQASKQGVVAVRWPRRSLVGLIVWRIISQSIRPAYPNFRWIHLGNFTLSSHLIRCVDGSRHFFARRQNRKRQSVSIGGKASARSIQFDGRYGTQKNLGFNQALFELLAATAAATAVNPF